MKIIKPIYFLKSIIPIFLLILGCSVGVSAEITADDLQSFYNNGNASELIAALNSSDSQIKIQAIYYLGELRDPDALNPLITLFESDPDFYKYIFQAITQINNPDAVDLLSPYLLQTQYDILIRNSICQTIIDLADEEDLGVVYSYFDGIPLKQLDDSLIHRVTDKFYLKSVPSLFDYIRHSYNPEWISLILVDLGDEVKKKITDLLDNPKTNNRDILLKALIQIQPKDLLETIQKNYIGDPNPKIRLISLKYISEKLGKGAKSDLFSGLQSQIPVIQAYAADFIIAKQLQPFLPELFFQYETVTPEANPYYIKIFIHLEYAPFLNQLEQTILDKSFTPESIHMILSGYKYLIPFQAESIQIRSKDIDTLEKLSTRQKVFLTALSKFNQQKEFQSQISEVFETINIEIVD